MRHLHPHSILPKSRVWVLDSDEDPLTNEVSLVEIRQVINDCLKSNTKDGIIDGHYHNENVW